jgi:hypothetical protein
VADLIRDSPFGHCVRLVTRNKCFQYPEEKDPSLWKKYVNQEKSGYVAHHGNTQPPEEAEEELQHARGVRDREDSETSSHTHVGEDYNHASGVRVDPEKGKDQHVIDWFGPDDPAVSLILYRCSDVADLGRIHATGREGRGASSPLRSVFSHSPYTSVLRSTHQV